MYYSNFVLPFFLICCFGITYVAPKCSQGTSKTLHDNNQPQNDCPAEGDHRQTLIIFDFSTNVISKEIFDVSIKKFLQLITEYCNKFKYLSMNNDCENCNVTIKECDGSFDCEIDILNLHYIDMTSTYSGELINGDSKNLIKFFNQTFAAISDCAENHVFLLTNRIILVDEYSQQLAPMIDNSCIKLTTILLGRNDINATALLQNEYQDIPNAKTLSLPNYDCLNYLFYCIIPCASNSTPECMQTDIDDCQIPTKTPNYFPKQTLHIWYILDFVSIYKNPITNDQFNAFLFSMRKDLKKYMDLNHIKKVRIRVVAMGNHDSYYISNSFEDVDQIYSLGTYWVLRNVKSTVLDDDNNHANDMLSLIPWSGTLTQTRIGELSINILTNYATKTLKTVLNGQKLQASMFVFDTAAYNYYSGILKTETNFNIFNLQYNDSMPVHPIQNTSPISSSTTPPITTSTVAPKTCPSSCENKLSNIQISDHSKFEATKSSQCETLIIFDFSSTAITKEFFDYSVKYFLNLTLQYCGGFKFVILDDNYGECESLKGCNITINSCENSNGCDKIIDNLDYTKIVSSYSSDLFETSTETTKTYLKFLKSSMAALCSCQENQVLLLTNRIVSVHGDLELSQTIRNSCIKLSTILLGKDDTNAAELLKLVYHSIPDAKTLSLPNYDCLGNLFYCLMPCSSDYLKCLQSDLDYCKISISTPNYYPDETLNLWCVYAFNSPFSNTSFFQILANLKDGINEYIKKNGIKTLRIRVVNYDNYFVTYNDVESLDHLFVWEIQENGFVIDDTYELNERLSMIPWSGTLSPTRPGVLSVIILTNYASTLLEPLVNGQTLQGSMYVYNSEAFEYYSLLMENNNKLDLFNSTYKDPIEIIPIINAAPTTASLLSTSTQEDSMTSATTNIISDYSSSSSSHSTDATTSVYSNSQNSPAFTPMPFATAYLIVNAFLLHYLVFNFS